MPNKRDLLEKMGGLGGIWVCNDENEKCEKKKRRRYELLTVMRCEKRDEEGLKVLRLRVLIDNEIWTGEM